MVEVRKVKDNDELISDLKLMWMECFSETEDSWQFYYTNRYQPNNTCVYIKNEKAVGMLTMLPTSLVMQNDVKRIYYIYAVATLPEFQRQGIASILLRFAKDIADKDQAILCLVPATSQLFSYYEKQGFKTCFYLKRLEFDENWIRSKHNETCKACTRDYLYKHMVLDYIDSKTYKNLRDQTFHNQGYIKWSTEAVHYALIENNHYKGFAVKISINNNDFIIMATVSGKQLIIRETTLDSAYLSDIILWLCKEKGCTSAVVYVSTEYNYDGIIIPFGMLSNSLLSLENGYLNLALDG